ncbi:ComEA family DNA-binding protein [Comamonas sp. NoAH]|uniref:ComEA family DNA-binding protein n=1 Tax=Comamonas halotolerans TaxID=3041496 RepID=UPI0024E0752C|nr:helix-hairpin-helix domain-containing protein [Comamonas sp. NoAH]
MLKKLIAAAFLFYAGIVAAVDINKASHADLTAIKGIGPATASRILDARQQGAFKSWDDLIARVSGIADNKASQMSAQGMTVNGQAFKQTGKSVTQSKPGNEKSVKPAQTASKKQEKR